MSKIYTVKLFVFIFQKCFDHKPRIISKRNKDNSSSCSHPAMHDFEDNKYVLNTISISCNLKARTVFNTDFHFLPVGQLVFSVTVMLWQYKQDKRKEQGLTNVTKLK